VNTFFGDFVSQGDERFGAFIQAAAVKCGKGRVAAFTDSTVFSNFTMFMPGKPTLALCTVNWLNRTNKLIHFSTACKLILALLLAFWVLSMKYLDKANVSFVVIFIVFTGMLASIAYSRWQNQTFYPIPKVRVNCVNIAFERNHCNYHLPILSRTKEQTPNSFQTFYVWTQRLGAFPCIRETISEACSTGQVVILIRPVKTFSKQEICILETYVNKGGHLLIISDPGASGSTAEQLFSVFGFNLQAPDNEHKPNQLIWQGEPIKGIEETSPTIAYNKKTFGVQGGHELLITDTNQTVISKKKYGRGSVVICTIEELFKDRLMGSTSAVPTREKWIIWNIMYSIFDTFDEDGLDKLECAQIKNTYKNDS